MGMSCRFPGASGVLDFWENLLGNADSVGPVPAERFDVDLYHSETASVPGKTVSRSGGFLAEPFAFDAPFFGISPLEARRMDPQQRLLLPVVWEALENAGIVPSTLAGSRTGVFIGQATSDYAVHGDIADHDLSEMTGSHLRAMTAGRISYALDLRGASVLLDTACSSSLVAVHSARQSLLLGRAIWSSPARSTSFCRPGTPSPTPRHRCSRPTAVASSAMRGPTVSCAARGSAPSS
ncbi:polyketide synthase [Streptacidiphilus sp. 4-A2]|nr:polyketide synthase [Streptacidiphilus sp. 4-A2]